MIKDYSTNYPCKYNIYFGYTTEVFGFANDPSTIEKAKQEIMEDMKREFYKNDLGYVGSCYTSFKFFQPASIALDYLPGTIDLTTSVSDLVKSSSVFYIIKPNSFQGSDVVSLKISDMRNKMQATFKIQINIGSERFSGFKLKSSDSSWNKFNYNSTIDLTTPIEDTISSYGTIEAKLLGYDEDGSAVFEIDHAIHEGRQQTVGGLNLIENNFGDTYMKGKSILKLGGWLPVPVPPGFTYYLDNATYDRFESESGLKRTQVKIGIGGGTTSAVIGYHYYNKMGQIYGNVKMTIFPDIVRLIVSGEMEYTESYYGKFYNNLSPCFYIGSCIFIYYYVPDYESWRNDGVTGYSETFKYPRYKTAVDFVGQEMDDRFLFILPNKNNVFPSDSLDLTIHSYGKNSKNSNVNLIFTLQYINETKTLSTVNVKTDNAGTAKLSFTLPSFSQLQKYFGKLTADKALLYINATDSRGINAFNVVTLYVNGSYVAFQFRDVKLPLPDDLWNKNIAEYFGNSWNVSSELEAPLSFNNNINIDVDIWDKETGDLVKSLILKESENVFTFEDLNLNPGKTYSVSIKFNFEDPFSGDWHTIKISDIGRDLVIPVEDKGINTVQLKIYIPYSLIIAYLKLAYALHGDDPKYKRILADQNILNLFLEGFKNISTWIGNSLGVSQEDNIISKFLSAMIQSFDQMFYIRPSVVLPTLSDLGNSDIITEIDFLNNDISYRNKIYNFTPDFLLDPSNYWGKFARYIVVLAETLKTYKYVMSSSLIVSKILALAITLDIFKGYFENVRIFGKENLFAKYSKQYGNRIKDKKVSNILGATKISLLELEGLLVSITSLTGNNIVFNWFKSWFGDSQLAATLVALTFKFTRFLFVYIIGLGEFMGEFKFEIAFQLISTIITHFLMYLYNSWVQFTVAQDILIYPHLSFITFLTKPYLIFKVQLLPFREYLGGFREFSAFSKPEKEKWINRNYQYGPAIEVSGFNVIEGTFYKIADTYLFIENIASILIAFARALDGIAEKI